MSSDIMYTRIQQKIDTVANWANNDPVLLNGEIGFVIMEDGSVRLVVGDGSSNYNQLATRTLYVPVVPTKVSDLNNDANYITEADIPDGIEVDDVLSSTSTNPVQNRVVSAALNNVYTKTDADNKFKVSYSTTSVSADENTVTIFLKQGTLANAAALKFTAGDNISLTNNNGAVKISVSGLLPVDNVTF